MISATLVLALAAAIAAGQRPKPVTDPFPQFNATILQWTDMPQLAGWPQLPFASPNTSLAPIDAAYDEVNSRYLLLLNSQEAPVGTQVWALDVSATPSKPFHAAPPGASCGYPPNAYDRRRDARRARGFHLRPPPKTRGALPCWHAIFQTAGPCFLSRGGAFLVCKDQLANLAAQGSPVRSLTGLPPDFTLATADVLQSPGGGQFVLVGSPHHGVWKGAFSAGHAGDVAMTPVPLTNTTGGRHTNSNVTLIRCAPQRAQAQAPFAPFGAACLATGRSRVCTSNVCPADVVHLIDVNGSESLPHRFIRVPGVVDAAPTGVAFTAADGPGDGPTAFLGNRVCVNALRSNGTLDRYEGIGGGLPQNDLTHASAGYAFPFPESGLFGAAAPGDLAPAAFFGSTKGAMLRRPGGASWKYFFGPRWLPAKGFDAGNRVLALAADSFGGAMIVTDGGITFLNALLWGLADKAAMFEAKVDPTFAMNGFSDASVSLGRWGDAASFQWGPSANSGLWTSMYLAGESYRYASLNRLTNRTTAQDAEMAAAKAAVWRAFGGMELLNNVTGIKGYPARCALQQTTLPGKDWHASPTMPGWVFWGGTSSDEITGHLHVYPLVHDLVAETPSEKARVLKLTVDITSNLVDHGMILYGVDGKPTQWGHWDAPTTNDNPFWYDERGLNSMQALAFLSAAYRLTGNETYATVFRQLYFEHGYGQNVINLKITQPDDVDYSDDELTFLAYLCFLQSGQPSDVMQANPLYELAVAEYRLSVERTWKYVHKARSDLWAVVFAASFPQLATSQPVLYRQLMGDLQWCLATWPTSTVDFPTNNSARLDVRYSPYGNRNDVHHMLLRGRVLPYDENGLLMWNGNPFDKSTGSGMQIHNPSMWLYPYWAGVYYGLLLL